MPEHDHPATPAGRSFTRSGAASRRPGTVAQRRPRRETTSEAAPAAEPVGQAGGQPPASTERSSAPEHGRAQHSSTAKVQQALQEALAALPDEQMRRRVAEYRPERICDEAEWAAVADLTRLGVAVHQPPSVASLHQVGWALGIHARVHLDAGTNRTITGWFATAAIETTLSCTLVDSRSLATHAERLRVISDRLVGDRPAKLKAFGRYAAAAPYSTAELEALLDHVEQMRYAPAARRLRTLIWLGCGVGPVDREITGLTGRSVRTSQHSLVVDLPGDGKHIAARAVPVFGSCEQPLAQLATEAGDASLWDGIGVSSGIASRIVHGAQLPATLPALTLGRLRATWLALVIGANVPLRCLLVAASIQGDRSYSHLHQALTPLEHGVYETSLRAGTGPLPDLRQPVLLPDLTHPAPTVPLRAQDDSR